MNPDKSPFGYLLAIAGAALLCILAFAWYQAGVQAEVYRRQNVEMTQWEIFVGCTPAERQIHFEKPELETRRVAPWQKHCYQTNPDA